jgi:iron-sulfur cluster assembly protein
MNYATKEDTESDKYELINVPELTVLLDKKAIFFVVGTTMDFEETELSSEFVFNNPNAKGSCGCGESFNV